MKKGSSKVTTEVIAALKQVGKQGITTEDLADEVGANRQYIRKVIRKLGRKVKSEGISSPKEAPVYRWAGKS